MVKMNRLFAVLILFTAFGLVSANGDALEEGKRLVESNISCDQLTEHQLEEVGEYYMEQMHPGTGHEAMHQMMGLEEGTTEEERFHINLAKTIYCGTGTSGGMMGSSMMGNMMGWNSPSTPYGYGMMGYYNTPNLLGWNIFDILLVILLVGLVILVYFHIWRKLKQSKNKR